MRPPLPALAALAGLAVSLGACASAPPAPATTQGADLGFRVMYDHTALHVADLDAAVAFYRDVFGLPEIAAPGDPAVIRWLSLGGDDQIHLIDFDGDVPPTDKAVHLALAVTDLDAFVAHLDRLGVAYSDWPGAAGVVSLRPDGVRQVYVQDPDGYWVEVNTARG